MSATLVNGQTSKPITQISDLGDAIRFSHSDGTFTDVPNHSIGVVQTVYKSTSVLITIKSEGERDRILGLSTTTLLSPVFTTTQAIIDTINAWSSNASVMASPYSDSAVVRRLDTIINKLTATKDTLKGLVFSAKAKVVTGVDTLFNCKSISFGRKNGASGTLVLGFVDGDSESFDIELDELPSWENGDFISWLSYDASATTGLILKTLGCNQTDATICAKALPIEDCDSGIIITTCSGWASGSGIWGSVSGCWNTGQ